MKRNWKRLALALFLALYVFIFSTVLLPFLHLNAFIPFLVLMYYERPKITALWWSCGIGLLFDILSGHAHFGIVSLAFAGTTYILYEQKPFFFEDAPTTLPILSALFSVTSSLFLFFLLHFFNSGFPFSWEWVWKDLFLMPLFEGGFAFVFFTLPLSCLKSRLPGKNVYIHKRRPQ